MRMLQVGNGQDLAAEAIRADATLELGCQHLESDSTRERELLRDEHAAHSAPAELAFHAVALAKGLTQELFKAHWVPKVGPRCGDGERYDSRIPSR